MGNSRYSHVSALCRIRSNLYPRAAVQYFVMPRPRRIHIPRGHFHVTLRGNHREPLFADPTDRDLLNDIVAENLDRYGLQLHAYCWMSNHLHALVQAGERPLGTFMQRIAMRYSRYRQKRMGTTGHLFERRYGARYIGDQAYFFAALRYIHLNPVAAGLVRDPGEYPWSSHRAYLGKRHASWLTVDFGLSLFDSDLGRASQRYRAYMALADDDLEVMYPPDDHPVTVTPAQGERGCHVSAARSESGLSASERLARIAADVCAARCVSPDAIRAPGKARCLSVARRELVRTAIATGAATLSEVAAFLERDLSTVSRLLGDRRPRR